MISLETDSTRELAACDLAGVVAAKLPQLRYMRTKPTSSPWMYQLFSIDNALGQAGLKALPHWMSNDSCLPADVVYKFRWFRNFRRSAAGPVFVSYMGPLEKKTFPFSYWTELVPYCFDCWPKWYEEWAGFYRRERTRIAFISARQSAEYFAAAFPHMKVVWLPEAVDPTGYDASRSWAERDIDVLEMGRKYQHYHHRIAGKLDQTKRVHVYERGDGESKSTFSGRSELVDGLARTKVLICFPRSQTHPEEARGVETVTYRYFQAMASKCLMVGHAPRELIDLFGYNPVIEAQEGREFEQIEWVLNNPLLLMALAERNYQRMLQVGTWKSRIGTILQVVRDSNLYG